MGTITSNIGLISGINTGAIIDGLISIASAPVNLLQTQITSAKNQEAAYQIAGNFAEFDPADRPEPGPAANFSKRHDHER